MMKPQVSPKTCEQFGCSSFSFSLCAYVFYVCVLYILAVVSMPMNTHMEAVCAHAETREDIICFSLSSELCFTEPVTCCIM